MPAALLAVAVGSTGCGRGPVAPPRDASLALQTDSLRYVLRRHDGFWETDIGFTFTNPTDDVVYLVGCGVPPPTMERFSDGEWVPGYSQGVCLALTWPPHTIEPGGTYRGTLGVWSGFPGTRFGENFDEPLHPGGVYRLVWSPRSDAPSIQDPFGPLLPLEQRVSNAFVLAEEPPWP